ncbi:ankyrin repeat domain-containing protein [Pleionea mediterranea]|uniref:Uncharacterized protein n=1 Tax=Pleionea mediterranea TaxID=523701 RepID=A0A316G159_9GAMM|nr:ankyrin repeat domain-containing protein [Pleionea mediterranea]PWK54343.1 hypothetical protein C8D97_101191 [Pleionea mediterranea]
MRFLYIITLLYFPLLEANKYSFSLSELEGNSCFQNEIERMPLVICKRNKNILLKNKILEKKFVYSDLLEKVNQVFENHGSLIGSSLLEFNVRNYKSRFLSETVVFYALDSNGCVLKIMDDVLISPCTNVLYDFNGIALSDGNEKLYSNLLMVPNQVHDSTLNIDMSSKLKIKFYLAKNVDRYTRDNKIISYIKWGMIEELIEIADSHTLRDFLDDEGNNLLIIALTGNGENLLEMLKYLLFNKIDVNQKNEYGYYPVYFAWLSNSIENTSLLIRHGADICLSKHKIRNDLERNVHVSKEVKEFVVKKINNC